MNEVVTHKKKWKKNVEISVEKNVFKD